MTTFLNVKLLGGRACTIRTEHISFAVHNPATTEEPEHVEVVMQDGQPLLINSNHEDWLKLLREAVDR